MVRESERVRRGSEKTVLQSDSCEGKGNIGECIGNVLDSSTVPRKI